MVKLAGAAIAAVNPNVLRVLGGMSPIDPAFLRRLEQRGVLECVDAVAVHGFPRDWNHWGIDEWPAKLAEIQAATTLPVWVSEVGVSSFGAEEVQEFGLRRTAELLEGRAPRIHWYSLFDLPRSWLATTRHREAEGSSYYRHFYMGLLQEDGSPKLALRHFDCYTPEGKLLWDGTNPAGRRVLVRCLHGLGDTIQFSRFLPRLNKIAIQLTVGVQPPLVSLFNQQEGSGLIRDGWTDWENRDGEINAPESVQSSERK